MKSKSVSNLRRFGVFVSIVLVAMLVACSTARSPLPPPSSPVQYAKMEEKDALAMGMPAPTSNQAADYNTENYKYIEENKFLASITNPLSTFSIDVDTASYSNVRRFLNQGRLPPVDAVRIEEMINYFDYNYPEPAQGPLGVITEYAACPWNDKHALLMIGMQGKKISIENLPPANLVFLLDVSGSMMDDNKLPLIQKAFRLLVPNLRPQDTVSIVVYAGADAVVLEPTKGSEKAKIIEVLDSLTAGGSTAGSAGIKTAYALAKKNFKQGGNNRVILATDGDFNVGISSEGDLVRMIEEYRATGIYLTVLGFGEGNYQEAKMKMLADKGNGNFAYIDNLLEAKKVLVTQLGGTLLTIAKDVKIQVEFNPAAVKGYRLIGYELRVMAAEDFNNDKKDAGELGAGHTVTALYEIIPAGSDEEIPGNSPSGSPGTDPLKYQQAPAVSATPDELCTVKIRYKLPESDQSTPLSFPVKNLQAVSASENFRFASAVAMFGLLLRDSPYKGKSSADLVLSFAGQATGQDPYGYRAEFIGLVKKYKGIKQ